MVTFKQSVFLPVKMSVRYYNYCFGDIITVGIIFLWRNLIVNYLTRKEYSIIRVNVYNSLYNFLAQ